MRLLPYKLFPHPAIKRFLIHSHNLIFHGGWDMPHAIGFEVSQACNLRCHYCPVSIAPMKQKIVAPEMWELFLSRLEEIKWRGILSFILFNEATLVPNFPDYVRSVKTRLPHSFPMLFTNGTRPAVIDECLRNGLFLAIITEHPPFKEGWREPIKKLENKWGWRCRVRRLDHPDNRAGIFDFGNAPFTKCIDNVNGMTFDVDGNMCLCCLDYFHAHQFGNLKDKTIRELWYSADAIKTRELLAHGTPAKELCHGCFQTDKKTDNPAK